MSTQVFRIPLVNLPQKFNIDIGGQSFSILSTWNTESNSWYISFYDGNTQEPYMLNTPLVTGVDLFAQYRYLNLVKGQFIVFTAGAELQPPTLENLGVGIALAFSIHSTSPIGRKSVGSDHHFGRWLAMWCRSTF